MRQEEEVNMSPPNSLTNKYSSSKKRWDDSQFDIELCDDKLLPNSKKEANSTTSKHPFIEKLKHIISLP